jgi:hypothetical protein
MVSYGAGGEAAETACRRLRERRWASHCRRVRLAHRRGFAAILKRIEGNGVHTIIVEAASRLTHGESIVQPP